MVRFGRSVEAARVMRGKLGTLTACDRRRREQEAAHRQGGPAAAAGSRLGLAAVADRNYRPRALYSRELAPAGAGEKSPPRRCHPSAHLL